MLSIKSILCHVGPWSEKHYNFIASELSPEANISLLSGHPKCDQTGLFNYYHDSVIAPDPNIVFNPTDLELDIILRCRLLRSMERSTALLHLRAMWEAMSVVLDRVKPDLVLTETIDSYVMDILYFQAKLRNITLIGLVPSFVSGYFRITARGEFVKSRNVVQTEIDEVAAKLLEEKYKPDFIKNNDSKLWLYAIGRWSRNLIKIPFFNLMRIDSRERFNYHNWATLVVSKQWAHWFPALHLGLKNWRALLRKNSKKIIYVPLQMIPEATVDYWCENIEAVDYDAYLNKLIQHFSDEFIFLIKEHPNVLGYRNPKLYRQLSKIQSVILVPTNVNSQELIDASDAVLVWTGSVGFEAAIRGKAVLTTCDPYYVSGDSFKKISLTTPVQEITTYIDSFEMNQPKQRSLDLIAHVLSGLLPGRYIIDGSWSAENAKHVEYAKNIAAQLKSYLKFSNQP